MTHVSCAVRSAALAVMLIAAGFSRARAQSSSPAHSAASPGSLAGGAGAGAADEAVKAYSVPESPAFTFLNVSPAKIARPTTSRDLSASIVNAIDESGRVRQGLAIEFQPSAVMHTTMSLSEYQRRGLASIVANTQMSLASVRSSGDSTATNLSYGIRIPIVDFADPMADSKFTDSVIAGFRHCKGPPPPLPPRRTADERAEAQVTGLQAQLSSVEAELATLRTRQVEDSIKACNQGVMQRVQTEYTKSHWNALHVSIAAAGGQQLASSTLTRNSSLGTSVWAVAGVPLTTIGEFIAYSQWADVTHGTVSLRARSLAYGGRLVAGLPTFNAFVEAVGDHVYSSVSATIPSSRSWSGGLEFRVADQLWLATGFGKNGELKGGPTAVIANLRWGISDKARFSAK